jgi:hypothetical protein
MTLTCRKIVIGDGLTVLPGRNFARFLVVLFIMFCMLLRTAYQGMQFEFMLKDMRPKNVETLKELMEENFTIWSSREDINNYEVMGLGRFDIQFDLMFSFNESLSASKGFVCLTAQCLRKC